MRVRGRSQDLLVTKPSSIEGGEEALESDSLD
ncbi:hypothetical protein TIFTF001_054244 [Ficus carica]|uniref:Uncharacterized protein n=1 Tax=Ficus carica TaxID=3494 RepID=A0AA88EE80_FICCA|nr:hypothetical protein TIFTF001_054244 [Ficus carica]